MIQASDEQAFLRLFERVVVDSFHFLEESGYARCALVDVDPGARDALARIRYCLVETAIDVEVRVGLDLFVLIGSIQAGPDACAQKLGSPASVELLPSDVTLPRSLGFGRAQTLTESVAKSRMRHQKRVAAHLEEVIQYLASRTKDVVQKK